MSALRLPVSPLRPPLFAGLSCRHGDAGPENMLTVEDCMSLTLTCCDAVRLEGAQRLTFLPDLFGGDFMTSEASVYAYAHRYCPDYQGGFWQFYRLPDGGGFMVPDVEKLIFCNADNWFEQTVSGEVPGIILTALILNHRSWHHSNHDHEELCRHFCRRHEQLMSFADTHTESATIWRALD